MKLSLYHGNSLDALKRLPEESVDCIVTSSPYYGLRDYSSVETMSAKTEQTVIDLTDAKVTEYEKKYPGYRFFRNDPQFNEDKKTWFCTIRIDIDAVWDADLSCQHEWGNKEVFIHQGGNPSGDSAQVGNTIAGIQKPQGLSQTCSKCHAWKGQLGLEPTYKMFIDHLLQITNELKRVLKPTGTMFWNIGDSYASSGGPTRHFGYTDPKYGNDKGGVFVEPTSFDQGIIPKSLMMIPERLAMGMIDQGWILRNKLIWYKPNGMPSSVRDRFSNKWEYIFFFSKNGKYYFDLDSVRKPLSEGSIKRISQKNIPNQFQSGKSMEYGKTSQDMSIPKILNNMHQKYEEQGAYTGKHSGYKNLDGSDRINENGANPGDVIYDSKYSKSEYGQSVQGFIRTQSIAKNRWQSRIDAEKLYPNDPQKQAEYIKLVHDHDGNPNGANPGDVIKEPAVRHKSWASNAGHNFTHERKYDPDADGGDFFTIPTMPHPFAHFAVYPETLIEPLIKAGCPKEVCSKCGKPKMPFREKTGRIYDSMNGEYRDEEKFTSGKIAETNNVSNSSVFRTDLIQETKTIMKPSCSCNASFVSGTVLDPFAGSGTTMLVARNLGRSAIGIDVNPIYSEIVKKRLQWGMGLDIEYEIIDQVLS
jgi:DNA modification methylase